MLSHHTSTLGCVPSSCPRVLPTHTCPARVPRHARRASRASGIAHATAQEAIAALQSCAGGRHRVPRDQVEHAVAHVQAVGKELGLNRVEPAYIPGAFNGALTTDVRQIDESSDVTSLGRLTFNQFKPTDAQVQLGQFTGSDYSPRLETGLPDLYRGPFEGMAQGYCLFTHFRVLEEGVQDPHEHLRGLMTAIAEYGFLSDKPAALTVKFRRLRIQPLPSVASNPERMGRWMKFFKAENPSMNDAGVAEIALPEKGPVGQIEYLLMDKDEQVHVGNMGNCMIMKRYNPPAGTMGASLTSALQSA